MKDKVQHVSIKPQRQQHPDAKLDHYFRQHDYLGWLITKHHKTHRNKPLEFDRHKYLIDIYKDRAPYLTIMKSTQNGCTEYLIVRVISEAVQGLNIFYTLPTDRLVTRFVQNRINKTITNTPYYKALEKTMAKDKDRKRASSTTLKEIGKGIIAFVGSNSTAGFTEFPADELVIDELDECNQANIQMGLDRLAASEYRRIVKIGNPTVDGYGITDEYSKSDKKLWFIKHDCGKWINIDWFKHFVKDYGNGNFVILDSEWEHGKELKPICDKCGKPFDRMADGGWGSTNKSDISGYHISKLFSGTTSTLEILDRFEKGLSNDDIMQRFYNADLGLPYTAQGARITEDMLNACRDSFQIQYGNCIMGVDVGKELHVRINRIAGDKLLAVFIGTVRDEQDIVNLWNQFGCICGVIDALPETRMSRRLTRRLGGMFMCYFGDPKSDAVNPVEKIITVNRTVALDAVKEAFLLKNIQLPLNASTVLGYYDQMMASTRVYKQDLNNKEGGYVWTEGTKADHYFLTECYALLARKLLVSYQGEVGYEN